MDTASRTPSTSIERVEAAHRLLTVKEAAAELRVCLSHAYELTHEYLNSGGTAGLPVLRFGTCMRVPRWALDVLITTGRVVRLADAIVPTDGLHRAS
ncbi:MAG: helix-turn-helix domain-containing protein [Actinomycetota bacterium]|nr:helix-turn-helix domain-containing protein [Actinomycetota bacterium]